MNAKKDAYKKYFWDLNEEALGETDKTLKDPDHIRFPSRMVKLLSRCQKPDEFFSIMSKEDFVKVWPKLRKHWAKISKESDFRDWWQTIYEEILKKHGKKKKIEGEAPAVFKKIGRRIREARMEKGMSQKDLALAVGMEQPDISKIEEGKKNITMETLARVCSRLDIDDIKLKD